MPRPSLTQLVLLEMAVAAAALGLVKEGLWLIAGAVLAVLFLALALMPIHRRPLYRAVLSKLRMRSRRRAQSGHGIASLMEGKYDVVTVARGSDGFTVGAIRGATTWTVPLSLPLVGVLNEDPHLPVAGLATLLRVEGVPAASVRVVTQYPPAPPRATGIQIGLSRTAVRNLVLTFDSAATSTDGENSQAVIEQSIRRCVMRAEEIISAAGGVARRLSMADITPLSAGALGPLAPGPDGALPAARESGGHVDLGSSRSITYRLSGTGAINHLDPIASGAPAPLVATSVALAPSSHSSHPPVVTLLLRVTGPPEMLNATDSYLAQAARAVGLRVDRLYGEQVPALKATTLLSVTASAS